MEEKPCSNCGEKVIRFSHFVVYCQGCGKRFKRPNGKRQRPYAGELVGVEIEGEING